MSKSNAKEFLSDPAFAAEIARLNGSADVVQAAERYAMLANLHAAKYGEGEFFSSPGRIEVCGNHTDHNNGKVLCASITVDTLACVTKTDDGVIIVESVGYPPVFVNVADLSKIKEEEGDSTAIIKGICKYYLDHGWKIGGFKATTQSNVFKGAGVSSSASFELLICEILNCLYNGGKLGAMDKAKASYFAENVYFGKPSGLLDQSAIALGGVSYIDFKSTVDPEVESIHWGFDDMDIVITNTGGDHCNLTDNYAAIRREMELVAGKLGGKTLREVSEEDFYDKISALQNEVSGRAIMRAMHFYDENKRVDAGAEAVKKGDESAFAEVINASGLSSYMLLQNCYPEGDVAQRVPLGINLSKRFKGVRAVRVHGGGFAGTILAFVDKKHTVKYIEYMSDIFGEENVFEVGVRNDGACKVNIR